jgi:imidazole glycerol-phosphate synthase subunit HisF
LKTKRIIPRLDIKGPNLVKGIHLEGLRVLGKPKDFAKYYYENGADELIFMDVVASLYERNSLNHIIEETAQEIFIPITVGGGIRSLDDIKKLLRSGADKVCINTAAIRNPELIKAASQEFGNSTIVVAIEAIKAEDGKYYAFIDNGREFTGKEVLDWALEVENLGAGEIILTSVDQEGTGKGFNHELTELVNKKINIPLISHGGAGNMEHIFDLLTKDEIDAAAIASVFHYDALNHIVFDQETATEGNFDFLNKTYNSSAVTNVNIADLKLNLKEKGIKCR